MESFKKAFLDKYLAAGMGSLSKRDIDVLVMHLLDEQGLEDASPLKSLSNQQVSVKLRAPANRIKTLRYEATLKYVNNNESLAKWKFLEVLAKSKFDSDKDKIGLIIEDAFTKNWLQGVLKSTGLVFDGSFNSEIIRVDSDVLLGVLKALFDEKSVSTLKKRFEEAKSKKEKISFAEVKKEFLKGAANGLGEKAAGLLLLVTT